MPFGLFESTRIRTIIPQINHHSALKLACTIIYSYYQLLQSLPIYLVRTWIVNQSMHATILLIVYMYYMIITDNFSMMLSSLSWEPAKPVYSWTCYCFLFWCLLSEFSCLYATISDDCSWFSSSTGSHTVLLNGPNSAVQCHLNSRECRNLK